MHSLSSIDAFTSIALNYDTHVFLLGSLLAGGELSAPRLLPRLGVQQRLMRLALRASVRARARELGVAWHQVLKTRSALLIACRKGVVEPAH